MATSTHILQTAQAIAQTLVNHETDVNELTKVATYARAHLDGSHTFRLLETMIKDKDSRYVVRTGQTLTYYREIAAACQQHLRAYRQAKAEKAHELAEILGWATRLMRYYNTVGTPAPTQPPPPPLPLPPVERLATTKKRELVTLVEDAKRNQAQVETSQGERLVCTNVPLYPPPKKGMHCRAEIIRKDGKAQSAAFKGWEF